MSRWDPENNEARMNTGEDIAKAARLGTGRRSEPTDLLTHRYEQHFRERGLPAAKARAQAEFWAQLKQTMPDGTVIDPDLSVDDMIMQHRLQNGTADPSSVTAAASQPRAAVGGVIGGPPTILEYSRNQYLGMAQPVNRFSLNPGREYYASIPGEAPTMFGAGDLPIVTGSGIDPQTLRWVAWPLRHTAAFTPGRADVALLVEASLDGDPDGWQANKLISPEGQAGLDAYFGKIATWVNTLPPDAELTDEEIRRFYPDGPDD